jgi:hypothetical protein
MLNMDNTFDLDGLGVDADYEAVPTTGGHEDANQIE